MQYGLQTVAPIRWLLESEPNVHKAVVAFLADQGEDNIAVAGPPSAAQILSLTRKDNRHEKLELPLVVLRLRKVAHHLTGEPGVEIKCSDREIDEIVRWKREAQIRKAVAANNRGLH
jgi:hypothetical protein